MRQAFFQSAACGALLCWAACNSSSPPPNTSPCPSGCGTGLSCVVNSDFPAGSCSATCSGSGGSCPAGTTCAPLSTGSYCLGTCSTSTPCPQGLTCTVTAKGSLCVAPAALPAGTTSCPAPQLVVGATAGPSQPPTACRTPTVSSALAPSSVQEFGLHRVGEQLNFTLPAGAAGFSIVSQAGAGTTLAIEYQGYLYPNLPVPSPVQSPTGVTFFDDSASLPPDQTTLLLLSPTPTPFTSALTFPNTSAGLALALDGGLPGGAWSFVVNDYAYECQVTPGCDGGATNSYDVSVLVKPGPLPGSGKMTADVYLVTTTLDAGTAVASVPFRQFATRYAEFYAQAGVCLTTVTLHDVPDWAKAQYASLAVPDSDYYLPCGDFRQLFTLAEASDSMALFFVDELLGGTLQNGFQLVGIDGSIPGPATFNGTIAGGAVVSAADLSSNGGCTTSFSASCGPDVVAYISAHETGHFLGLFHPTEQTGDVFDPLADTPACVCSLCELNPAAASACGTNPDGGQPTLVQSTSCSGANQECGGASLLMFWILDSSSVGNFSPQQAAVVRANPLVSPP
jgi:hypothetical protein